MSNSTIVSKTMYFATDGKSFSTFEQAKTYQNHIDKTNFLRDKVIADIKYTDPFAVKFFFKDGTVVEFYAVGDDMTYLDINILQKGT